MKEKFPDENGYFGSYGGRYVIETLIPVLKELEKTYLKYRKDEKFQKEFNELLIRYAGRPTPLYYAERLTEHIGKGKVYLKREDLLHTGAHKINNTLGQGLLAKRLGKTRLIAETGAGQHGVATATVAALFGMRCDVYMGTKDMERQKINVFRMKLLGANVIPVDFGSRTLKDAINEALRDWIASSDTTHYVLGSVLGPHPFPMMVRDFQSVIGKETRKQILEKENRLADYMVACVGGGSNSIGFFYDFLDDTDIKLIGVEAGGLGIKEKKHAARFQESKIGILHGTKSYCLQDPFGQIRDTHSVSAGLDYPSVGPEHAFYHDNKRIEFTYATDEEALNAFSTLTKLEGIIPALESAHAVAWVLENKDKFDDNSLILINLSGRGDKDVHTAMERFELL